MPHEGWAFNHFEIMGTFLERIILIHTFGLCSNYFHIKLYDNLSTPLVVVTGNPVRQANRQNAELWSWNRNYPCHVINIENFCSIKYLYKTESKQNCYQAKACHLLRMLDGKWISYEVKNYCCSEQPTSKQIDQEQNTIKEGNSMSKLTSQEGYFNTEFHKFHIELP